MHWQSWTVVLETQCLFLVVHPIPSFLFLRVVLFLLYSLMIIEPHGFFHALRSGTSCNRLMCCSSTFLICFGSVVTTVMSRRHRIVPYIVYRAVIQLTPTVLSAIIVGVITPTSQALVVFYLCSVWLCTLVSVVQLWVVHIDHAADIFATLACCEAGTQTTTISEGWRRTGSL